jgi:flavin reductase (DIM6/NTAB) family NADH-FMN oxidoreductase RutF
MSVPALELRRIFGTFATGVTVVTCRLGERTHGITVNSFTSLSLDPPLVLVCIDRRAIAWEMIPAAGSFAVNVLSEQQRWICDFFAKRLAPDPDHEFAEIPHESALTGAPIIEGALAVFECRLVQSYPGGDHDIYVGEVLSARLLSDERPLIFHRGRFPALA